MEETKEEIKKRAINGLALHNDGWRFSEDVEEQQKIIDHCLDEINRANSMD